MSGDSDKVSANGPPRTASDTLEYERESRRPFVVPLYRKWLGGVLIAVGAPMLIAGFFLRDPLKADAFVVGAGSLVWGLVILFQHLEIRL